eukprot:6902844-Pyramimonas_sp.AAC.1
MLARAGLGVDPRAEKLLRAVGILQDSGSALAHVLLQSCLFATALRALVAHERAGVPGDERAGHVVLDWLPRHPGAVKPAA